jgi:hypothetical protein
MPPLETPPAASPTLMRYRVALYCPTPLEFPELELDAVSEDDAWRQFCAVNGISDSEHPRAIAAI